MKRLTDARQEEQRLEVPEDAQVAQLWRLLSVQERQQKQQRNHAAGLQASLEQTREMHTASETAKAHLELQVRVAAAKQILTMRCWRAVQFVGAPCWGQPGRVGQCPCL